MAKVIAKNPIKNFEPAVKIDLPINVDDLPFMEADLEECENEPGFEEMSESYTGPATGLEYDDEKHKLRIVDGWHVNEDGFIVKDEDNDEE